MPNRPRVYLKPFKDDGTYEADFIDVSNDVVFSALGDTSQSLDNTEFDIGIYRTANLSLSLKNINGKYSNVDQPGSVFRFKRSDSLIKITWDFSTDEMLCGLFDCDSEISYTSEEIETFIGFLNDETLSFNPVDQISKFNVLGLETIMGRVAVPFASLSIGQSLTNVIYTILNQTEITSFLTVNLSNIVPDNSQTVDSVSEFENKTVLEALKDILLASNSVMTIENSVVYVKARDPSANIEFNFYGQASVDGAENIVKIGEVKSGVQRVINFITWLDTAILSQSLTSVEKFGVRKKSFGFDFFTNTTKQQNTLDAIVSEFSEPKQEFEITTKINYDTISLKLLDKISIDYPAPAVEGSSEIPLWGVAVSGVAVAPLTLFSFSVVPTDLYKIIGKKVSLKDGLITFRVRQI